MDGVASVIHEATEFISNSTETQTEERREDEETGENKFQTTETTRNVRKSSRALCLICGLIFTIFVLVICQIVLPIIQEVTQNESFWESTNRVIGLFEKYNMSTIDGCNNFE